MIRILLVDDHTVLRQGLEQLLRLDHEMAVVGHAGNGFEALEQCEKLRPDIVLMDIVMPGMDGVTATRFLRQLHPEIKIIIFSVLSNDPRLQAAAAVRPHGFLSKNDSIEQITRTIREVWGSS